MAEELPKSVSKEDLLSRIKASYAGLYSLVEGLENEAFDKSLEEGDWTIKDILAHIAAWEDVLIRFHIQAQPFDQVIGMESVDYWKTSEDEMNEYLYRRHRGWSGERVLSYLQRTHESLIDILEGLSEGALTDPPVHSGGEGQLQNPLIGYIVGNTYEHFEEHLTTIQEILDRSEE